MRDTKTSPKKVTEEQAKLAMTAMAKAEASTASINAKMESKFQKIRDENAEALTADAAIIDANKEVLFNYAEQNQGLFTEKKSFEIGQGTIGYKTSPESLTLPDGIKDDSAVDQIRAMGEPYGHLLNVKYSLNKSAIKSTLKGFDPSNPFVKKLVKLGFSLVSEEKFFVKTS